MGDPHQTLDENFVDIDVDNTPDGLNANSSLLFDNQVDGLSSNFYQNSNEFS